MRSPLQRSPRFRPFRLPRNAVPTRKPNKIKLVPAVLTVPTGIHTPSDFPTYSTTNIHPRTEMDVVGVLSVVVGVCFSIRGACPGRNSRNGRNLLEKQGLFRSEQCSDFPARSEQLWTAPA